MAAFARRAWRSCVRALETSSFSSTHRRDYRRIMYGSIGKNHPRLQPIARFSTGGLGRKCWSCGTQAPSNIFLCSNCNVIQPADSTLNHFDAFGIERNFELDTSVLEKRYKDLQKKLHPDLYSLKSEKEQAFSADQASQVINAYQTLLRPLPRATYLLETLGVDVEEEGTVNDPEILMEVMEMQETVSESADPKKLRDLQTKAQSRMKDYEKVFIQAMKKSDIGAAKEAVQRMSYFDRIIKTIIQKL